MKGWRKPENPPEKSGYYIAITDEYSSMFVLKYSKKHDKWNADDEIEPNYAVEIFAWTNTPALPDWIEQ